MNESLSEVRLLSVPVRIWEQATAHQESLQREFDILRVGVPPDAVPHRLHAFISNLDVRFADPSEEMWESLRDASERGDEEVDVSISVPAAAGGMARNMRALFTEVDEYCRSGDALMTLAAPPELVEFREWFLGEFERQINDGLPPTPWVHTNSGASEPEDLPVVDPPEVSTGEGGVVDFAGELDITSAAELQARIQEQRSSGVERLTINLAALTFIDSVGLSVLVTAHNRISEEGKYLMVVLPENQRPLFEMSGLTDILALRFV